MLRADKSAAGDSSEDSSLMHHDSKKPHLRIVHTVSSLLGGGMEHVVVRLAAAQKRRGHQVSILALHDGPLYRQAQEIGLPVFVIEGRHKTIRAGRAILTLARLRPDIIHAHNPTSLQYAVLGKWVGKSRVVMTDHAQTRGIARAATAHEQKQTDAVVAVSAATAERRDVFSDLDKVSVIHNGVDLPDTLGRREEVRASLGLGNEITGIMVAGMDKVKGHQYLLEAIALLRDAGMRLTILVAGDGAERTNLEQQAEQLGLGSEWIRFLGFRSDVSDLLSASDFLVLPSLMEGLPIAILEAMAHRLPVVATPVGGIPEIITNNQQGLLVPVQDVQALADAMTKLVNDTALRKALGDAGYQRVQTELTFDGMVDKYELLYYRLCLNR